VYKVCVITNGNPYVQRKKAKALNLEKEIDHIYYAEDE
jgi:FMN phosphatase YigB (HAD superfamily)